MMRKTVLAAIAALVILGAVTEHGPLLLGGATAHAIVGRPATPVSYAGVARRTTRRTAYAAAPAVHYAGAARVAALPAGCALAGGIYTCGAVRYRPYYDGPTVVYVVVD